MKVASEYIQDGTQKKIIDTPIVKHPKATHGLKRSPVTENQTKKCQPFRLQCIIE